MRTEQNIRKIRVLPERAAAQERPDPEALWRNPDIEPEELIRLDPLDDTEDLLKMAAQATAADRTLYSLPERRFSLRQEAIELKCMKAELQAEHREHAQAWVNKPGEEGSV